MRRFGKTVLTAVLISAIVTAPVYAAPTVDELEKNKAAVQSEVSKKQGELQDLLIKIDELEAQLITKGQEIITATAELATAEETEKKQYDEMKLRIKYMYEEGNNAAAEKILKSKTIAEVLNQTEYAKSIHTYDRKQLEEYVATKETIVQLKATLETEAKNLETMQASYETEKESLNSTIASKQAEVAGFDQQIQAAAEVAAAAAEERQRQEAERIAANNNSNTSSSSTTNTNQSGGSKDNAKVPDAGGTNTPPVSDASGGQAIVNAARAYLGVPYVWGGESGSGVDCSGLVLLAHRAIGVRLSHSSGAQGGGGKAVNGMANALPGDVVCYSGHVGIYIGGGQMIHAPQPGEVVKVSSVYGSPWFRRYW